MFLKKKRFVLGDISAASVILELRNTKTQATASRSCGIGKRRLRPPVVADSFRITSSNYRLRHLVPPYSLNVGVLPDILIIKRWGEVLRSKEIIRCG